VARLYANENFPLTAVQELRRLGHDVLTTVEAGRANQAVPDADVLAFAIAEGRALLTLNRRDFIKLARINPSHSGVIVCSEDTDFVGQAERIHREISPFHTLDGELIRIRRPPS
jgi:hypothetical protein